MIKQNAKLHIRLLPLEVLQVKEVQARYLEQLHLYIGLLQEHPGEYAGLLHVAPSDTHKGMYILLDGHTRFCAYIMTGREYALCVIEEDV